MSDFSAPRDTEAAMIQQRQQRYESFLHGLASVAEFRREDLPELVGEETSQFISRTMKEITQAGLLRLIHIEDEQLYQWPSAANCPDSRRELADHWIRQRLHGDQVKLTPPEERPRERLLRDGATALSTADLLAILIRNGIVGESAVTGGRKLANHFHDSLEELRDMSLPELRRITPAVTKASYGQIMAAIELGRRVARAAQDRPDNVSRITSTVDAVKYCERCFAHLAGDAVQEEFHIVTLDVKHQPIRTHRITVGTLDSSLVHPREVFRPAIRDAAAAILLVHNHPSGDPTPSREDHQVTQRLTDAGKLMGIKVLDHVIVARLRCLSLRESG